MEPTQEKTQDRSNLELEVGLGQRYTAAWTEISQRLTARQTVHLYFATVTITAIGALVGFFKDEHITDWARNIIEFGTWGLVFYVWAFALWIRNNDAVIGLLGVFCRSLEAFDVPRGKAPYPAWHTESQGWILKARSFKRYSDFAAIIFALLDSSPAFILRTYLINGD